MKKYGIEDVQRVLGKMEETGLHVYRMYYLFDFIFVIFFGAVQCMLFPVRSWGRDSSSLPESCIHGLASVRGNEKIFMIATDHPHGAQIGPIFYRGSQKEAGALADKTVTVMYRNGQFPTLSGKSSVVIGISSMRLLYVGCYIMKISSKLHFVNFRVRRIRFRAKGCNMKLE